MNNKLYWHELTEEDIEELYDRNTTWGDVMYQFNQPDWCTESEALRGSFGCWSLIFRETRPKICDGFCRTCESHRDFMPTNDLNDKPSVATVDAQ